MLQPIADLMAKPDPQCQRAYKSGGGWCDGWGGGGDRGGFGVGRGRGRRQASLLKIKIGDTFFAIFQGLFYIFKERD